MSVTVNVIGLSPGTNYSVQFSVQGVGPQIFSNVIQFVTAGVCTGAGCANNPPPNTPSNFVAAFLTFLGSAWAPGTYDQPLRLEPGYSPGAVADLRARHHLDAALPERVQGGAHRMHTRCTPDAHPMHTGTALVPPVCIGCASGVHGANP